MLGKFSVPKQEFELVEYFKKAEKLHYGLTKREALKLAFQFGNENGAVMQELGAEECADTCLRGLRKHHESCV
jgi:hypothetical protein